MRLLIITMMVTLMSIPALAKPNVFVSILPQKYFIEKIAGNRVDVNVMVLPGASPATYEPKPKQMVALSKADAYFSVGVPFERTWLPKFREMNKSMAMVATDKDIKKRTMAKHVHKDEHGEHHHDAHDDHKEHGEHHHDKEHKKHAGIKDPHVWLDPILVKTQAGTIADALCSIDESNCSYYISRKAEFLKELDMVHIKLKRIFRGKHGTHFMVFHPSWGYIADRYHLKQVPVELEGKEPKPSELKEFIKFVKKENLNAIFIQPQFSKKSAELIAKETGAKVVAVNPLSEDWENNLIHAAMLISGNK